MMGEPLFDEISAAVVVSGVAAIIVLRLALAEPTNADRSRQLSLAGHLLLGIAASFLVYRWAAAAMSLPLAIRPNVWRSGALSVACGIGAIAAVKSVIGLSLGSRVRHFLIAAVCGALALLIAAQWEWAVLLLTLLVGGVVLAVWISKREALETTADHPSDDRPSEPAMVLLVSSALLLLLLGNWQHVIEHESQRKTRSSRYSAWPRATALRSAWERSNWILKPDDADSAARVANAASQEQRVALGLGTLLLVVTLATWSTRLPDTAASEADDAG